ncbi:MAG: helix-turn-helix domain-containing protein [Dehalococcoidia bacterium]|nr:helix-turn-helix domain-containing protein [Dehalococcoidia bacterium]MCA9852978.1 helix-turn-helix domain-containing protein [Dehalococcoidia bacterium]
MLKHAKEQQAARATVAQRKKRYREEGVAGLADRSSRPHRSPRMTPAAIVAEVCRLPRELAAGPHRIAWKAGDSRLHRLRPPQAHRSQPPHRPGPHDPGGHPLRMSAAW